MIKPEALASELPHGPWSCRGSDWQRATPLHDLCGARDEDHRSTPLGWAARNDLPDMVELLLARGAATELPDDQPWATPLVWATRRGHGRVARILRRAGAAA